MRRTKLENWICKTEALPELTREGLEALQLWRLNETLTRLKQRGGIYAAYPDKLETLAQLQTLPFTTPEMLSANPGKFLLTSQSEVSRVISGATSGTTGPAKRVFYTERDTEHTIGFFAAGISEMLAPGEKCFIAFPFTGPFGLGDLIAKAVERLGGEPIRAGFGQTWGEMCSLVRQTQPETYIGFPVTLLSLARMYGPGVPIQRALVSGDACPEGVMEELEKLLGSRLYPHYGSRECGLGGAVTCQAFEGMHLRENHIIPEIIDEHGNVLADGEYGELVITTIGAEAMPLIRYRTGDYTRILPPCPCGGVTKRLDTVSRKESLIAIEQLDSVLFRIPELVDYRVRYDQGLKLEARLLTLAVEKQVREKTAALYPKEPVDVCAAEITLSERPMYLGKRGVDFGRTVR
ncbi:MAG: AMP-binding protein [Oscillospiraceae bacterium]|nr:AMP-binding protein [Oscillospiraceae bacterium]